MGSLRIELTFEACSGGDKSGSRGAGARRYDVSASFAVKLADGYRDGIAEPARQGRPPGGGELAPYLTALLESGRSRSGYHDAGTGCDHEGREGCDGVSGLVVPDVPEGGLSLQRTLLASRRRRTCVRRVRSRKRTASRACARRPRLVFLDEGLRTNDEDTRFPRARSPRAHLKGQICAVRTLGNTDLIAGHALRSA